MNGLFTVISEDILMKTVGKFKRGIVVASFLHNTLAVECIRKSVALIITQQKTMSSHAANILRACRNRGAKIEWFAGYDISPLQQAIGKKVELEGDKFFLSEDGIRIEIPLRQCSLKTEREAICRLNIRTGKVNHIYFPETYFSNFAFSLMQASLKKELSTVFGREAKISLANHHIHFENAPYLDEINNFACDINKSWEYFKGMQANYESLISQIKQKPFHYPTLCSGAKSYYSTFLVLHRSYTRIFGEMESWLHNEIGDSSEEVMACFLHCELDYWLFEQPATIINRKVFLQDEPQADFPEFDIADDINHSFQRLKAILNDLNLSSFFEKNHKKFAAYTRIFVLKEWKFLIYKVIFTHIKAVLEDAGLIEKYGKEFLSDMTEKEVGRLINKL